MLNFKSFLEFEIYDYNHFIVLVKPVEIGRKSSKFDVKSFSI